jgi:hypothetical protein
MMLTEISRARRWAIAKHFIRTKEYPGFQARVTFEIGVSRYFDVKKNVFCRVFDLRAKSAYFLCFL